MCLTVFIVIRISVFILFYFKGESFACKSPNFFFVRSFFSSGNATVCSVITLYFILFCFEWLILSNNKLLWISFRCCCLFVLFFLLLLSFIRRLFAFLYVCCLLSFSISTWISESRFIHFGLYIICRLPLQPCSFEPFGIQSTR